MKFSWYQLFKYSVYTAVFINVFLFLRKELASGAHRFSEGFTLENFTDAFTSTIDTAAWVVLLILFELETWVIPYEKLQGSLKWIFRAIRALCYAVIVTSFFGYIQNYFWLAPFELVDLTSLCEFTGQSWMIELDEFETITAENCAGLAEGNQYYKYSNKTIFTDNSLLKETYWLAVIDILNSLAWILVVIVLEVDVWLQLKNQFKGRVFTISRYIKNVLYLTLLFAAIYWGIFGDFLEFWDAFLWIVAFVFIEMNLLEWKAETDQLAKV